MINAEDTEKPILKDVNTASGYGSRGQRTGYGPLEQGGSFILADVLRTLPWRSAKRVVISEGPAEFEELTRAEGINIVSAADIMGILAEGGC